MSMKKVFSIYLLSLLIIVTAGCKSGVSSQPATPAPAGTGTATVFWNPVKTYTDSSSLTPAGYKIYFGTAPGYYTKTVNIMTGQLSNPNSPRYTINGLSRGTKYYFAVCAYDSSNVDSDLSIEVSKTIN
jgi:hypothetical protein